MESSSWHSYPSIYNLGHAATAELFDGPVVVEEKVDGSQFSFGVFDGEVKCRSKGQQIIVGHPEGMFAAAVEMVKQKAHLLKEGFTYRGEYLQKPKHNTLAYSRIPAGYVILFDINPAQESYMSYDDKAFEAERIGLEVVPLMHLGEVRSADEVRAFLDRESVLGGQKVEGVVIKNYAKFGPDKKALMGKFVSEAFKEKHQLAWKQANPNSSDIVTDLVKAFKTEARWRKAVQHLREDGKLENSPRDIPLVLQEIQRDLSVECSEDIVRELMRWAKPKIMRGVIAGAPEWYKQLLMESQFETA